MMDGDYPPAEASMRSKEFLAQLDIDPYLLETFRREPVKTLERFHFTIQDAMELAAELPGAARRRNPADIEGGMRDLSALTTILGHIAQSPGPSK
jgi:hypothetical protein